ncbi:MAG TPA: cell division protein FtsQ/DivIB [Candidatus Acidoferrum sp.]|nr:cell division protein FtsQ/DivIB [Candidatus Acidoferrum sp.]
MDSRTAAVMRHPRKPVAPRAIERLEPAPADGRVTRMLIAAFSLVIIGVTAYGVNLAVNKVNSQRIEKVHISGALAFVTEEQIKQTIGADVSASLVNADLGRIKQKLEDLPWIRQAEVRREWPDALDITVEEEIAIARWGNKELLNQQGQVFAPDRIDEQLQLPLLAGPVNSEGKVMRQYQEFNQLLYPLGVRIRDLTLHDNGSYSLTLTNGVWVKLGRQDLLERLRRLVMFLQSEFGKDLHDVEAIDLRYRNGLAVARHAQESGKAVTGKKGSLVTR